jgi:23S rRNA (guanosine2251-2'-O)-methyltransferase
MRQLQNIELNRPDLEQVRSAEKTPVTVVLDNIRSGLNVGAIFRTCDAFTIERIILCGITVQPPHVEIMKTALGATESVAWEYMATTAEAIQHLKAAGIHCYAVEQTDSSVSLELFEIKGKLPMALILGNEMKGVNAEALQLCDGSIEIPQSGIKHSLNVATSAGIVLWECYRQFLRLRFFSSTE